MHPPYNVLFLCTGNSARSIIAEAYLNSISAGQFVAFSAGSHPAGTVNPHALEQLQRAGISTTGLRSKSWDEFASGNALPLHFVFTVCDNAAGEVCPLWPGQPLTAHWGVPDPAAATGDQESISRVFLQAYTVLSHRISLFANLPIETLGRLALKTQLSRIGGDQQGSGT